MSGRLDGKTVIVTGGSRGIGLAIAMACAKEGGRVVVASRKQAGVDEAVRAINAQHPGQAFGKTCHAGHVDQLASLVEWTAETVGNPTILVNNAATNPHFGPLLDAPEAAWDKTFQVNLKGYFAATRQVVRRLLERGEPGSIINISSVVGLRGVPLQGVYAMTKAAVISMTRTLAMELGPAAIRVNAIAPGLVDTQLARAVTSNDALARVFTDRAALGRFAQPEEIAGLAVFLASDESSFVTGQVLCADGGWTAA
jgi:NAD(P)-dependent dehydrogenase (short-subunit alcohol dehydrogenase family)